RHDPQPIGMDAAGRHVVGRIEDELCRQRYIDFGPLGWIDAEKLVWHHSHNRERHVSDDQFATDHIPGTVKPALPKMPADHNGEPLGISSRPIVSRSQISPHQRRSLQGAEELPAYHYPVNFFVTGSSTHLQRCSEIRKHIREDFVLLLQPTKEWGREVIARL